MTHRILISSLDLVKLEGLLKALADKSSPGRLSLEEHLAKATIVDSYHIPENVVSMNSTMEFSVSSSGARFCLPLVYPKDVKSDGSTISILAPIGSALLGQKQGDEIYWPNPGGKNVSVRIEKILYQPERSVHFHR